METIVLQQRNKFLPVDTPVYQCIIIRRKHLWADALHHFHSGLDFKNHFHVTFVGEPAIDAGDQYVSFCIF